MTKPKLRPSDPIHHLLAGGLSAIGSLPLFLSAGVPGYDASSHVAKTAFLMYSFAHGNFLGWSQFWYSGFQLFYTYSPLTYVLAGGLGWAFDSAMVGMKLLILLSFILSGLGAFALARDFGISPNWSLIGALLYSLTSPHILILFSNGSLTYSLAFAVAPFLFWSGRIALRNQTLGSSASFGALIALMILSNATSLYVLFFPLLAYFLISIPKSKALRSILVLVASSMIGFLLSGFWLIPYLQIDLSGQLNLLTESATGTYASSNIIHWYSFFIPDFGNAIAGDVGWILLLPALASVIFLRRREEFALLGAVVVSTLLTIGPTLTPLFYKIPLVLALHFAWRFDITDVLFMAPLAALFFWRLSRRLSADKVLVRNKRKVIALSFILLFILVSAAALSMPKIPSNPIHLQAQQNPSDSSQQAAFNFLASQPGFFRVMVVDRYYEAFPQYTLKGSIDGWYDEATTQAYRNYTYNIYYCGASDRTLGALQLLGARYVLIDYAYGGDGPSALQSFNSTGSVFGPAVFKNSEVEIYQVPDSQLVYVTASMPNSGFSLSQDVNCNEPIPAAPASQENYSLSDMTWGETSVSLDVDVNQPSYVLVSNAYAPGWVAEDNGSSVPILLSPPGLPVIHVSAGLHHITLSYSSTPTERDAAILSLGALLGLSTIVIWRWHRNGRGNSGLFPSTFGALLSAPVESSVCAQFWR
jgi:6-pyruvoyl-tetrahydropterin synthase related domain